MERFTNTLLAAFALTLPAATAPAQTPSPASGGGSEWGLGSPFPPADSGKATPFDAPARHVVPPPPSDCQAGLVCKPRLEGVVRRGGAVELKVTPFSW